jgi:hypothetical protein
MCDTLAQTVISDKVSQIMYYNLNTPKSSGGFKAHSSVLRRTISGVAKKICTTAKTSFKPFLKDIIVTQY